MPADPAVGVYIGYAKVEESPRHEPNDYSGPPPLPPETHPVLLLEHRAWCYNTWRCLVSFWEIPLPFAIEYDVIIISIIMEYT